jgi:fructose/tagatose bisphosphate aldolase
VFSLFQFRGKIAIAGANEQLYGEDSAREHSRAGSFNVAGLVLSKMMFSSAKQLQGPVVVTASEGERGFMRVCQIAALVQSLREELDSRFSQRRSYRYCEEGAV